MPWSSCDWPSFRTRITTCCCSLSQSRPGDNFSVTLVGNEWHNEHIVVPLGLGFEGSGKYMAVYNNTISGRYNLGIIGGLRMEHIVGSPFLVTVQPGPTVPSMCLGFGPGVQPGRAGDLARPATHHFAPRSVRRALLTSMENPGSLYRGGEGT